MEYFVSSNWQDDLISKIKHKDVVELYGKYHSDFVGGGRPSFLLPRVGKKHAIRHIEECHRNGMRFNYLFNAPCLANREFSVPGRRKLDKLLTEVVEELKADAITVASPYMIEFVKKRYPDFEVDASQFANIDSIERAKYWESLGVGKITLPIITRNFRLLKAMRKSLKCKLVAIANNNCLYHCPNFNFHNTFVGHSSQKGLSKGTKGIDYYRMKCDFLRISKKVNYIRGDWIRPEDVHFYENIGINQIKIVERHATTEALVSIVNAYVNRRYDGNLLDLMGHGAKEHSFLKPHGFNTLFPFLMRIFQPFKVNIFRYFKKSHLFKAGFKVYIDNRALDGFFEKLIKIDCENISCEDCGYCEEVAEEVVKVDQAYQHNTVETYKELIYEDIVGGRLFKYS